MKFTILISILLLLPISSFAQHESSTLYNARNQELGREKYFEIKGSPYMFKQWVKADLMHLEEDMIEGAEIRYDMFRNEIEVRDGGLAMPMEDAVEFNGETFIILDDKYYRKLVLTKKDNPEALKDIELDTVLLLKGIHRDYLDNYAIVLYDGKKVKLVKTLDVKFIEKKYNTPGKIEKVKKFQRNKGYALIYKKEKTKVKLKDKEFYKVLGRGKELSAFKKSNKLKMKKLPDFIKMLKYYETLK